MTVQLHEQEEKARSERDGLLDRLHELTAESSTARLENQSLKVCPSEPVYDHISVWSDIVLPTIPQWPSYSF